MSLTGRVSIPTRHGDKALAKHQHFSESSVFKLYSYNWTAYIRRQVQILKRGGVYPILESHRITNTNSNLVLVWFTAVKKQIPVFAEQ